MPFTLEEAKVDDAAAIAKIFTSDETSNFLRMQLGTVDPSVLNEGMTERLAESIQKEGHVYIIARNDDTGEIVSYAHWALPRDEMEVVVEQSPEEKAKETEEYRKKLLPGMNEKLVMDFREGIHNLQDRVLKGRRHYLLWNLGTLPSYQRRGAGSALTSWPFDRADKENVLVYLDTDDKGQAHGMYSRLGFRRVDEVTFDLSEYGGEGMHTHMAMIREPQQRS